MNIVMIEEKCCLTSNGTNIQHMTSHILIIMFLVQILTDCIPFHIYYFAVTSATDMHSKYW